MHPHGVHTVRQVGDDVDGLGCGGEVLVVGRLGGGVLVGRLGDEVVDRLGGGVLVGGLEGEVVGPGAVGAVVDVLGGMWEDDEVWVGVTLGGRVGDVVADERVVVRTSGDVVVFADVRSGPLVRAGVGAARVVAGSVGTAAVVEPGVPPVCAGSPPRTPGPPAR